MNNGVKSTCHSRVLIITAIITRVDLVSLYFLIAF